MPELQGNGNSLNLGADYGCTKWILSATHVIQNNPYLVNYKSIENNELMIKVFIRD